MYELYPYFTNDGSVGLYSPEADDIYHSTYGAFSEGYEKFVIPAKLETYLKNNNSIKVLDICYGIGYNTKSFLNYLYEKKYLKFEKYNKKISNKNINIDTIDTNNIYEQINSEQIYSNNISANKQEKEKVYRTEQYNDTIDTNNFISEIQNNKLIYEYKKSNYTPLKNNTDNLLKVYIKALDIDEMLFYLSPFFRQGNENDKKHNHLNFRYNKISKLLNKDFNPKYQLQPEINALLIDNIFEKLPQIFENKNLNNILTSKQFIPFFDKSLIAYYKLMQNLRYKNTPLWRSLTFLHNIYYKHLSNRYKRGLNSLLLNDFTFEPLVGDARTSILEDKNIYDFIFLDAFTPAKCPALWSLEFFRLLFEHLSDNGIILTYSNSAAIRNGMINAGFYVGKIYNNEQKKFIGTVAVKNKDLIEHELSEYDLGLINSKAGIFYRDENLNGLNSEIIKRRENEVENSDKISSSRFIKDFRRQNEL